MSDVIRYRFPECGCGNPECGVTYASAKDPHGDFVLYEDYADLAAALQQERERAEQRVHLEARAAVHADASAADIVDLAADLLERGWNCHPDIFMRFGDVELGETEDTELGAWPANGGGSQPALALFGDDEDRYARAVRWLATHSTHRPPEGRQT